MHKLRTWIWQALAAFAKDRAENIQLPHALLAAPVPTESIDIYV